MSFLQKFRERRGEMLGTQSVVAIMLFCICMALLISALPIYNLKQNLDTAAKQIVRYIEVKGCVNSDVNDRIDEIRNASGINFSCKINGDYISGTQKIQLENKFTVMLEYDTAFGIGGILSVPITVPSKQTGVSEKYYK